MQLNRILENRIQELKDLYEGSLRNEELAELGKQCYTLRNTLFHNVGNAMKSPVDSQFLVEELPVEDSSEWRFIFAIMNNAWIFAAIASEAYARDMKKLGKSLVRLNSTSIMINVILAAIAQKHRIINEA